MEHTRVELAGVPETLLWNLYQRATEARRPDRVLDDPWAVELVDRIDYPFAERFGSGSLGQWQALRASRFDLEVRRFLADTPVATRSRTGEGSRRRSAEGPWALGRWVASHSRRVRAATSRRGWWGVGGGQVAEGLEVPGRLAARACARPTPCGSTTGEAQLEDRVERRVGGRRAPRRAAGPPRPRHGAQRQPAAEVDVAEVVEGERDGVQLGVALEQPAVDGLVVLVRAPAHEGVHRQAVRADDEAEPSS